MCSCWPCLPPLVRQGKSSVRTSAEQLWPCFTRARSVLWSGDGSNLARPSQTPKYCRRKNIFGIKQILMNITSSPPSTHYSITYDITIQYIQIPSKLVRFCYWFRNSDNNWLCLAVFASESEIMDNLKAASPEYCIVKAMLNNILPIWISLISNILTHISCYIFIFWYFEDQSFCSSQARQGRILEFRVIMENISQIFHPAF